MGKATRRIYIFGLLNVGLLCTACNNQFVPRLQHATAILPTDTVEVPLEETFDDHPFVQVMVNGRGPFRLAIETGSPLLRITPHMAQAIGRGALREGEYLTVDSLQIGDARFKHVRASIISPLSDSLDGMLGLNVYYDLLTTIDFAHHSVQFTRDTLPAVNNQNIFGLQPIGDQVYGIDSWIDSTQIVALLDTQNNSAFIVVPSHVTDTQFLSPPVQTGVFQGTRENLGGVGTQPERIGRWKGHIRVGRVTFQQPLVAVAPMPFAMLQRWNIGWPTLRQFVMTLDQRTSRIRLTSPVTSIAPPPPRYDFIRLEIGFTSESAQEGIITDVFPAQIAEGVKVGDVLVSINGRPCSPATARTLDVLVRRSDSIRVVVRRGTETKTIVLTKHVIVP